MVEGTSVTLSFNVSAGSWFSPKKRIVKIHADMIETLNAKDNQLKFSNKYEDVLGITKSLRVGSKQFIVHFKTREDEEWQSEHRDEMVKAIIERFRKVMGKGCHIFGVSTPTLADYLTTDKDMQRKICKMPDQQFLISDTVILDSSVNQLQLDDDEFAFDDWVIINEGPRPEIEALNTKERLNRATLDMTSSESVALLIGKGAEQVTLKDFLIKKIIDKGSFGKVFLVENKNNGKVYAMKRLNKDVVLQKNQVENIKVEKEILFQADHPFVNSMDYVFQNDLRIYFFLKYVPGGNIYDNLYKIQRFEEKAVKFISAQIVLALGYLHSNNIVHRDLKPENVLMDGDGYICLADFGLAKFLKDKDDQTYSFCGTAEYLAPEILDMKGHGFSVDWWTLGILMYEMATGRPPFMNKSHHRLGILIRTGKIIFPDPDRHGISMSEELQDLITQLLHRDASQRIGAGGGDANEIINHAFFAEIDWQKLQQKKLKAPYIPEIRTNLQSQADGDQIVCATIEKQDAAEQLDSEKVALIMKNKDQFRGF